MKNNILITMGILVLLGVAVQGLFGIVAGVFLSAILGIIYGAVKKNKQFLRWSVIALTIDIICIILFYFCLILPDSIGHVAFTSQNLFSPISGCSIVSQR